MPLKKSISFRKTRSYCAYLAVLYYLLPFQPAYLYYVSSHAGFKAPFHTEERISARLYAAVPIPIKGKSRFDFSLLPCIRPVDLPLAAQPNRFASYLSGIVKAPLLLSNSNRGPPSV